MERIEILKTYKLYIGGQFPRSESGRYYTLKSENEGLIANVCLSSKKDVKNAAVAARKGQASWASRSAFNRSQIIYRLAEMMEGRKAQFLSEMVQMGVDVNLAENEINLSIDRAIYYAGWCDKYSQITSSVNPVASRHFNFTVPEPVGVVGVFAAEESSLVGLISTIIPLIAGGNTCVVLVSEKLPLCGVTLAEAIHSSDMPGGIVNILTGSRTELIQGFTTHMDIDSLHYSGTNQQEIIEIEKGTCLNLKRTHTYDLDWMDAKSQGLEYILDFQEYKTTWHPIDPGEGVSAGY
jgi:acyl-CoA reductase-like NAD-dependent aldehyde dehydrogenase